MLAAVSCLIRAGVDALRLPICGFMRPEPRVASRGTLMASRLGEAEAVLESTLPELPDVSGG
eukprot:scaffold35757_cov52-Phaeocystis_antarctica.AAC.3